MAAVHHWFHKVVNPLLSACLVCRAGTGLIFFLVLELVRSIGSQHLIVFKSCLRKAAEVSLNAGFHWEYLLVADSG